MSYYLNLHLFYHKLLFICSYFDISYTFTFAIMCSFLHIDIFRLLSLILIWSSIDFYTLIFLCYLLLYSFHHVLIFRQWHFYITYTYISFNMYCFLVIDILILLIVRHISSCIGFYTMTFLYYLHLFLLDHVFIFKHLHFYITYI